ncbi:hypothetical protein HX109_15495 [Galbibacter sp. BG1]|uniref:hypothetical protein n=1 Tax=Galbibacter sp. BG1 TaxID=1170699 RepID=UPI0015BFF6FD|nr:hypothetical protein [Galbibacter sp. BG1]QLE02904.1 hypothetical protein HX109_15495 [Galbibacter sp. BG1]
MKTKQLNRTQKELIKKLYLQRTDEALGSITSLTVKEVEKFRKENNLTRNAYSEKKLNASVEKTNPKNIEVYGAQELDNGTGKASNGTVPKNAHQGNRKKAK